MRPTVETVASVCAALSFELAVGWAVIGHRLGVPGWHAVLTSDQADIPSAPKIVPIPRPATPAPPT